MREDPLCIPMTVLYRPASASFDMVYSLILRGCTHITKGRPMHDLYCMANSSVHALSSGNISSQKCITFKPFMCPSASLSSLIMLAGLLKRTNLPLPAYILLRLTDEQYEHTNGHPLEAESS